MASNSQAADNQHFSFESPLVVSLAIAVFVGFIGGALVPWLFAENTTAAPIASAAGTAFKWFGGFIAVVAIARQTSQSFRSASEVAPIPYDSELLIDRPTCAQNGPIEWSAELLRNMEWKQFEMLAIEVFQMKGLSAEPTHAGPEEGCDILLQNKAGQVSAVAQCKGWNSKDLGIRYVRELMGTMAQFNTKHGVLVAKAGFTAEASALATAKGIRLVSGAMLLSFIAAQGRAERQRLLEMVTTGDYRTPTCPACHTKMVRRKGDGGAGDYWGCRQYPACKNKMFLVNLW